MGIKHDLALFDITIFLEEAGNFSLGETGVDSGDEKVGARVDSAVILGRTTIVLGRAAEES